MHLRQNADGVRPVSCLKDPIYMQVTMTVTSRNLHCNIAWPKFKDFCNDKCCIYDK